VKERVDPDNLYREESSWAERDSKGSWVEVHSGDAGMKLSSICR